MSRPDTTAWWTAQVVLFAHRYLASPSTERRAALLQIMESYADAVKSGQVTPPRFDVF